jgi:hypothetical protein
MGLALSPGADPLYGAQFLQGYLEGTGLILVHDAKLLGVIDEFVGALPEQAFHSLLPILRRTFSMFPAPERKQIGALLAKGKPAEKSEEVFAVEDDIDEARAARVLPMLRALLGS